MSNNGIKILAIAGLLGLGVFALQSPTEARSTESSYIGVGSRTLVPYGWVDFCNRYGNECRTRAMTPEDVAYSPTTAKIMSRINTWVNKQIKPQSDIDHWNVVDHWDYPSDGRGDCEDYVLLKRKLLMQEGFPRQALLITVVKDEKGDGHAVLTVKTTAGEFILDNLNPRVKPWNKVPYRFVKRQSQADPNTWVEIGEPTSAPLVVSR
ncbi:MAG: transglutaminase-like cysteine peptidase [Beijerinckiaceae bacterium]|jgi:predicted transglutaminase-like cysteine proteinase|nr:transglutaminase-like cysteine peptidase [Beijerinckiaceae bacterium]